MSSDWDSAKPAVEGERLPPHSIEAEQGVLGCILISPADTLPECIRLLKGGPDCFYDLRHKNIYKTLLDMFEEAEPIDLITLQQSLRDLLLLEGVGGLVYLSSLPDAVPSSQNLNYYIEIILEKHVLRRMIQAHYKNLQQIQEEPGDVSKLLLDHEKAIGAIVADSQNTTTVHKASDLLPHTESKIEKLQANQTLGQLDGLSTGLIDLDKLTQGIRAPEIVIVAARPAAGKSSMGMGIAEHNAHLGHAVGFFSMEMSAETLMFRLVCGRAKVSMSKVRNSELTPEDYQRFSAAEADINQMPLYIDEQSGLTLLQLKAKARRMHQLYDLKLIVIDYLQLICVPSQRYQSRQDEIRIISSGLSSLAKELKVPIVVLCQLNREQEKSGSRRPRLSDLREGGNIEQDADIVCALWRGKQGPSDDDQSHQKFAEVIDCSVLKNRNGPTGDCQLTYIRPWTRFQNLMT